MVWLAFKDRLFTRVRMRSWGIEQGCVYCGERNEDRDQIFFACPSTFTVWLNVAERFLGNNSVYVLWKERNSRRHGVLVFQWT
ncbi:BnaC06g02560D [Brassica napus]|uniref:(rape) hypothetical protein n=1 Tax=Brassica napus TaxID=3708 RepID=A0A078IDE9_BRANA|nr:unnamed protein product [Brassica napus]CDY48092.1 BnaC06g02560D [Brassica napus]